MIGEARRFALSMILHGEEVRLRGREWVERWMTEELIYHARREGVEIPRNTRLPAFTLDPDPDLPNHLVARIECEVWRPPPRSARV